MNKRNNESKKTPIFGQPDKDNWAFFWKNQLLCSIVVLTAFLIFAWWLKHGAIN